MSARRVVITGIGLATPLGIGGEPVWNALMEKKAGVRRITAFDPGTFPSQAAGEIDELQAKNFVPKAYRKSTKVMARDIEIAVACAYEAVRDAGLVTKCFIDRGEAEGPPNVDSTRFGANIGAGLICADLSELAGAMATSVKEDGRFDIQQWGRDGMTNLTPLWLLKFLPNMLSCHVTIVHDAQAPSNTITCSEASSHLAIGEAFRTISRGSADVCICGGAESKLNPMGLMRQQLLKRLTFSGNDDPASACKPFDASRDGTVISEGGGLLILEEYEHAKARNARIYAEVVGFGASCNAHSWTGPCPEGRGVSLAIRKALKDAGLAPGAIGLISTFGTGIREQDASEARGIHDALGEGAEQVPALAIKGSVGNNGAGSGAIDLAVAACCVKNQMIPPSLNVNEVDPDCGLNLVKNDPRDAKVDAVLSIAYSLGGGQNAALILKRGEA